MTLPEREKTFQYGKMNLFSPHHIRNLSLFIADAGEESEDFYLDTIKLT